jgi:hypothetical protein
MERLSGKESPGPMKKLPMIAAMLMLLYVLSYAIVRMHHLSIDYVSKKMLFESQEHAQQWKKDFEARQETWPLDYRDSEFLYIAFWPVIKLDSMMSGRPLRSPFEVTQSAVPKTVHSEEKAPAP